MKKPILFIDFDGTLCYDRYWRSLPDGVYKQLQELLFKGNLKLVNEWMKGKHTSEEINQYIANSLDIKYKKIWEIFVEDCKRMEVSQNTLRKIRFLGNKFTTILITGNMDSFTRFTVPALELNNYFDYISNSYYEKKAKTDNNGELFTEHAQRFKILIQDCILMDDSQNVCDVFNNLGGTSHLITPEKDIDYYLSKL